ncbi:pentapeptide repeat-containing protein [Eggerthella guodeyinii]|uniref:Pentapeptide repeat-containing protein n=2 Tax=Eggerthella TaxID=84111 RepID=A0A6L7IZ42_9ACTN|nr:MULTISPECIES: pentapeptide repeat-containing protein [Eggerthella]MBC5585425.1 pentapeptide repeat-containing protein [Eggerthella hominis]QOS69414.1 pentapeptide repeat-containing protein [Eggerthella guodeyinii]
MTEPARAPRPPQPARPDIPGELVDVEDLARWIERSGGDMRASHVHVRGDSAEEADFALLELAESRVEGCSFVGCDFDRAMVADVAFANCDFSNSTFSQANFTRCTFASCKFTGADFLEAVLSRVEVRDSTFAYASLAKGKLEDVRVGTTDFSHADLAELRQRRVEFDDVRFVGTSFFRCSLDGVDLSTCQLADIVLSDAMGELRGCSMDLFQAAGIARRLGVNIKD